MQTQDSNAMNAILLVIVACAISSTAVAEKLKSRDYKKHKDSKAVVLLDVDWARAWSCGGFENAQLLSFRFDLVSTVNKPADEKYSRITLETPSRAFARPKPSSYGFLVDPGLYALTELRLKVARSSSEIGYLQLEKADLIQGEDYKGGTVLANAGEVIYVGHFGLDCAYQPTLWRYYLTGKEAFDEYVAQTQRKFKFLKGTDIVYRLFATTNFGSDPNFEAGLLHEEKGNYTKARDSFTRALELATEAKASPGHVSAILYNLGRMVAHTCDYSTAEQHLHSALDAERKLAEPNDRYLGKRLSELAFLAFFTGDYEASARYYAEAITYIDRFPMATDDPVGFADYLSGYAKALDRTGSTREADDIRTREAALRTGNEDKSATFTQPKYAEICGAEVDH